MSIFYSLTSVKSRGNIAGFSGEVILQQHLQLFVAGDGDSLCQTNLVGRGEGLDTVGKYLHGLGSAVFPQSHISVVASK